MTLICVPLTVTDADQALAEAKQAQTAGAGLVELRVDGWADRPKDVAQLVQAMPLPVIVTCRHAMEGGGYEGEHLGRMPLYEQAAEAGAAYVDVELAAYQQDAAFRALVDALPATTKLILSTHDFDTRPADLTRRVAAMQAIDRCDVVKAAWMARSIRDNLEAFELVADSPKPAVMLCMGPMGLASRALAKKAGAAFTFAKLDGDEGTAPGQPTVSDLKGLFRWDAQTKHTKVFGVVGMPVGHSMSPAIHNAGFDALQTEAADSDVVQQGGGVYLPMPVAESYEAFKATIGAWIDDPRLNFAGASVTIPHKENLLRFVAEHDGDVEALSETIGAANTLTVLDGGQVATRNTDYAAILDSVTHALSSERDELKGQRVAIIGAGGAARAAVAGFASLGAQVVVYNRTLEKAQALVDAFQATAEQAGGHITALPLDQLKDSAANIYIQCTPMGMHPNVDQSPFDSGMPDLAPGTVVFDTIYNPAQTKWLKQGWDAGCLPIPGTEMFVRQAAVQFETWTKQAAPLAVFRHVLSDHLGAREEGA